MTEREKARKRLRNHWGYGPSNEDDILDFTSSEVALALQPRPPAPELAAIALMRRAVARTMEVTTDGDLCLPRWGKRTEFLAAVRSFMAMTAKPADLDAEGQR